MHRLGYKDVLIDTNDLLVLNPVIDISSVRVLLHRANKGVSKSWINQPDPNDSRNRLITYSSIPPGFKKKYALPDVQTLIEQIKNDQDVKKLDQSKRNEDTKLFAINAELQKAADNSVKYCNMYLKTCTNDHNKVVKMARTHAVITACKALKGIFKLIDLHSAYLNFPNIDVTLKNYNKFVIKINSWQADKCMLVHKSKGLSKQHLIKVTDYHAGKIEQYYTHPNQYTLQMVTDLVNKDCKAIGLKTISVRSIGKYVSLHKNRLLLFRNNEQYLKQVKPFTRRKTALYSGDLYYADGSPLQIICWNKAQTQKVRLNLFAVMDLHSQKIVGFDLAESEDRYNWIAAMKMAFSMEMLLPFEMVCDKASATKTAEFITLKNELEVRGCKLNPDEKGNPKAKAQIERWFGSFQTSYQRMIDGYLGEGIRSKRDNGRIDATFLKRLSRKDNAYTYESMVQIVTYLISFYNQKSKPRKAAPSEIFKASARPNASNIGKEDIALLFWLNKQLKVKNGEIATTIRHNDYYYQVYDNELLLAINNKTVKVYYDEADLSQVHVFSLDNQYIGELRQKIDYHAAKANQTAEDIKQIIRQSKHNDSLDTTIKKQTAKVADKAAAINQDAFYNVLNPFDVAKDDYNTSETKIMLDYINENKGIDSSKAKPYQPIELNNPLTKREEKKSIESKYSKQFQDSNPSLEVVGKV